MLLPHALIKCHTMTKLLYSTPYVLVYHICSDSVFNKCVAKHSFVVEIANISKINFFKFGYFTKMWLMSPLYIVSNHSGLVITTLK